MGYFRDILCASVISGVVILLSPKDKSGGKMVVYICSLALTAVILTPIASALSAPGELISDVGRFFSGIAGEISWEAESTQGESEKLQLNAISERLSDCVESSVREKFGEEVRVSLTLDTTDITGVKIENVTVFVGRECRVEESEMESFIAQLTASPCTVKREE